MLESYDYVKWLPNPNVVYVLNGNLVDPLYAVFSSYFKDKTGTSLGLFFNGCLIPVDLEYEEVHYFKNNTNVNIHPGFTIMYFIKHKKE